MKETILPDGRVVHAIDLKCGNLSARVLTLGAIVQDLRIGGYDHPLVLGCPDISDYLDRGMYIGALVGRCANRISNARINMDGVTYDLDTNFRARHTLHGGHDGTAVHLWQIKDRQADHVILGLTLPDGHMGFPGNLCLNARIALQPDGLVIDISATTDAPTPCNIVHHGYFNLDGQGDIRTHMLQVDATHYLPVDDDLIPLGQPAPVAETGFDFRQPARMGRAGLDHNFCLGPVNGIRQVAKLQGENGLTMVVETDAAGLQVYDGAHFTGLNGLEGRSYGPCSGVALETQAWPDAVGRPDFPDVILQPEQTYRHHAAYRFSGKHLGAVDAETVKDLTDMTQMAAHGIGGGFGVPVA
jgi:aldose 1-epimerase